MIKEDEPVVMFCSRETYKVFPEGEIPEEAVVLTEVLKDNEIIVVPRAEFLEWLYEGGQVMKS